MNSLSELLAMSTAPVVLISGVSLLLLVINTRFIHVTDRARSLIEARRRKYDDQLEQEINVLIGRARVLQSSMVAIGISILSSSLIVVCSVLKAFGLGNDHTGEYIMIFLLVSTMHVTLSILLFILDLMRAMLALKLERRRE